MSKKIFKNQFRKIWVLGDIHGGYRALEQILERSGFDNENDLLIFVGDVADGWSQTKECVQKLMEIKNLVHIRGNHDDWAIKAYSNTIESEEYRFWFSQGGESTAKSYGDKMPIEHLNFLQSAVLYCEICDTEESKPSILITHGGFDWMHPVENQYPDNFFWDRDLISTAFNHRNFHKENCISDVYKEIYVGHTPTLNFGNFLTPQCWSGVWNVDTAAAYTGKLSIINIDTKEFFQSDFVRELYPDEKGRNRISFNEEMKK